MRTTTVALLALVCQLALLTQGKQILMVQTLTRHGTRAPDKIVGSQVCRTIIDPESGSVRKAFVEVFGTGPAELTSVGVRQMRDVGAFLRERYHGFLWADYPAHSRDWEFIAREGTRQQRSMAGLAQGIFPDDAVPITVTRRETDAILGGPAPQCADITHDYIVDWHRTTGKTLVRKHAELVRALERVCNVSLLNDPVNALPGGANPHAYIGDISDLMDSLYEANREPLPISYAQHQALTELAFEIEQGAHFDYPGGAAMHAGDFPNHLLAAFEEIAANDGERPSRLPKMRMHTCSRELHYGLTQMFGWQDSIRIPGQPIGRIRAGTTFIWELHSDMKIRSYYYQFPDNYVRELQPPMTVQEYRAKYNAAVEQCGDWKQICVERRNKCVKGDVVQPATPEQIKQMLDISEAIQRGDNEGDESSEKTAKANSETSSQTSSTSAKAETSSEPKSATKPTFAPSGEEQIQSPPVGWLVVAFVLCGAVALAFRRRQYRVDYSPV